MAGKKTIALFGATGPTGRHIIDEALKQGYNLSVYTRDAKKLASFAGRVEIVVGDLQDQSAIAKCVQGADAVISALGPAGNNDYGRQSGRRRRTLPVLF